MRKLIALRSDVVAAALLAVLALAAVPVRAQDYPNRPITLIVPFPPGGSTTIVGRLIADKRSEVLRQSIVVDNRGGAGGTIGSRTVAKSAADGYTILLGYTGTLRSDRASTAMSATILVPISSRSDGSAPRRIPWWCIPQCRCVRCPS